MTFDPYDLRELLTFARLLNRHYDKSQPLPTGWHLSSKSTALFSSLDAFVFVRGGPQPMVVIAIKGVEIFDPRDLIGTPLRRSFGYAQSNVRYAESVFVNRPWAVDRVIIGHSGGGGLASWLASHFAFCRSVVFNSGRTRQSFENNGEHQIVVRVAGDRWSDPITNPKLGPELPGKRLILEALAGENKHAMTTIIAALERRITTGK